VPSQNSTPSLIFVKREAPNPRKINKKEDVNYVKIWKMCKRFRCDDAIYIYIKVFLEIFKGDGRCH
jgi:hypothetical protein